MRKIALRLVPLAFWYLAGCQQQMASQPSYRPDEPSAFFSDGRAARPFVAGTVARGHLRTDAQLFAGAAILSGSIPEKTATLVSAAGGNVLMIAALAAFEAIDQDNGVREFPFPVTVEVIKRGQNRYLIYCAVCHDPLGTGRGMIVERGYTPPPTFHMARLRQASVGHFFEVITKGYGSMPSYKSQIPPRDRWAIIAYVRALQLSQRFPVKDLPQDMGKEWAKQAAPGLVGGQR